MPTGKDLRNQFKPLMESDLTDYTDKSSLSKGLTYYRNGYISETVLRGNQLQAHCEGSEEEGYRVQLTLVAATDTINAKLEDWDCSCPRGGFCKHIVALALSWIYTPEKFAVRQPLTELVEKLDREALVALVLEMVEREPDLALMVEAAVSSKPSKQGLTQVDTTIVRQQIAAVYRKFESSGWSASRKIAAELEKILKVADKYLNQKQYRVAQAVYTAFLEENSKLYETAEDHDGDIASAIQDATTSLTQILDAQPNLTPPMALSSTERLELMRFLFDIRDIFSDFDDDIDEVITRNSTPTEKKAVEGWLRDALALKTDDWGKQHYLYFLMTLRGWSDQANPTELLEEYRRYGMHAKVAETLLELGNIQEAVQTAQAHFKAWDLVNFADKLAAKSNSAFLAAVKMLETKLTQSRQLRQRIRFSYELDNEIERYNSWLATAYTKLGNSEQGLNSLVQLFEVNPSTEDYEEVKKAAQALAKKKVEPALWLNLRKKMLQTLEQRKFWNVLEEIYLTEEPPIETLRLMERLRQSYPDYVGSDKHLAALAAALKDSHPAEALKLYQNLVANALLSRQKSGYVEAIGYLKTMQSIYLALKQGADWQKYLTEIKLSNKSLRSFIKELELAGL